MITTCGPRFLTNDDFATNLTPTAGVPTRLSTPDEITIWHLANRTLLVDTEAGHVFRGDGVTRTETVKADTGAGQVYLGRVAGRVRLASAHRVVWIARHGAIPGMYRIGHINERRWDNRIANLALITCAERQLRGVGRLTIDDPDDPDDPDDRPSINPYTTAARRGAKPARANRRNIE